MVLVTVMIVAPCIPTEKLTVASAQERTLVVELGPDK
jgi:hypothetical protein